MSQTYTHQAVIKQGGIIEFHQPELPEGTVVDVSITIIHATCEKNEKTLSEYFGEVKNCFQSTEKADAFVRAERNAWD